uniref:Uncharacterized protein n=1 Tax=Setaria viridis TaxID=4556 RepID=A0A4U6V9E3_SETVI|nr:hypothetical protein SEVIR_3G045600v2 [Setaria viridis]
MKGMHKYSCRRVRALRATPVILSALMTSSYFFNPVFPFQRQQHPCSSAPPRVMTVLQSRGEQQLTQGCLGRRRSSIHADELGPSGGAPSLQKRWPREGPPSRRRSLSPSASDARDGEGDGSRLPRPRVGSQRPYRNEARPASICPTKARATSNRRAGQ